ncbi:MIF2 [Auxenochlorella protothecoides x Auxenochlorella symbiontica]
MPPRSSSLTPLLRAYFQQGNSSWSLETFNQIRSSAGASLADSARRGYAATRAALRSALPAQEAEAVERSVPRAPPNKARGSHNQGSPAAGPSTRHTPGTSTARAQVNGNVQRQPGPQQQPQSGPRSRAAGPHTPPAPRPRHIPRTAPPSPPPQRPGVNHIPAPRPPGGAPRAAASPGKATPGGAARREARHPRTPEQQREWLKATGKWIDRSAPGATWKHPRTPEEQREWLRANGMLWEAGAQPRRHPRTPEEQREWLRAQGKLGPDQAPRWGSAGDMQQQQQQQQRRPRQAHPQAELWGEHADLQDGRGSGTRPKPVRAAPAVQPPVVIPADVTVLRLASLFGCPLSRLEGILASLGSPPGSEQELVSPEDAELAAMELGVAAVLDPEAAAVASSSSRDAPDAAPRPAVVAVMGHVDHGKTTLLDALRRTALAAREAGGITQHIGAFSFPLPASGTALTFLDTPGHAAFCAMRARGAAVTDIVVLVVAADDGVMPQTREALAHARAAGCPVVVALTKCDVPGAAPARVRAALLSLGLELEEAGGTVQVVEVAAPRGTGLDALEEALLLQAEMMDLRASPSARAAGVVVEARLDRGRGPVATVVVRQGTLRAGDVVVAGAEWGRVRAVRGPGAGAGWGSDGRAADTAGPGQPAEITGLRGVPAAGDALVAVESEARAQALSAARAARAEAARHAAAAGAVAAAERETAAAAAAGAVALAPATSGMRGKRSVRGGLRAAGGLVSAAAAAEAAAAPPPARSVVPLIVKADVAGSVEAVCDALAALSCRELELRVVHAGVGPVSASDVQLAVPLRARVVAFGVRTAGAAVDAELRRHGLTLHRHDVIYKLLEELGEVMLGEAPRVEREVVAGEAAVLQVFDVKATRGREAAVVAGCRVQEGSLRASHTFRVLRAGELVHEGPCASLRRVKLVVEAVGKGGECGVALTGFSQFRPGDVLRCISVEMVRPEALTASAPEGAAQAP